MSATQTNQGDALEAALSDSIRDKLVLEKYRVVAVSFGRANLPIADWLAGFDIHDPERYIVAVMRVAPDLPESER